MKYSKEFKEEALKLSDEIGLKKAAQQLGIQYYTLSDWRSKRNAAAKAQKYQMSDEELKQRNLELEKEIADNCSEEYLFHLKDTVHEFSIGLINILECLHFAEEQGAVPQLPPEWWIRVENKFPDLSRRE